MKPIYLPVFFTTKKMSTQDGFICTQKKHTDFAVQLLLIETNVLKLIKLKKYKIKAWRELKSEIRSINDDRLIIKIASESSNILA